MSKQGEMAENESLNASDLSRAFVPGARNNGSNEIYCSTTRKQQEVLNKQRAQAIPASDVVSRSSGNDFNDQLDTPRQPSTSARRKRISPQRRDAMFRREVRMLQRSTSFMIPPLAFSRVVREIIMGECIDMFRITVGAMDALQTATEMFMTQRFQDAYLLTHHRSRVTLEVRDMALMAYICKQNGML